MPIAKSLSKVQKKVSSSSGAVHPKGRKFKQLTRASLRQEKLAKDKTKRNHSKEGSCEYWIMFLSCWLVVPSTSTMCTNFD